MDPESREKAPAFNFPTPDAKKQEQPLEQSPGLHQSGEVPAVKAVEQGTSAGPMPAPPVPSAQPTAAAADPAMPQSNTSLASGMPQIADDTDLIEKEWVEKAKLIVERTAHDPYLQNKEINKMKVDYLKKRYNKDVKLSE